MSSPITSEINEVAVFNIIIKPTPWIADNGKTMFLFSPFNNARGRVLTQMSTIEIIMGVNRFLILTVMVGWINIVNRICIVNAINGTRANAVEVGWPSVGVNSVTCSR